MIYEREIKSWDELMRAVGAEEGIEIYWTWNIFLPCSPLDVEGLKKAECIVKMVENLPFEGIEGLTQDQCILGIYQREALIGPPLVCRATGREVGMGQKLSFEEVKKCVNFLFDRWFSGPLRKLIKRAREEGMTKGHYIPLRGKFKCFWWWNNVVLYPQELRDLVKLLKELNLKDLFEFRVSLRFLSPQVLGKTILVNPFRISPSGAERLKIPREEAAKIPFDVLCQLLEV